MWDLVGFVAFKLMALEILFTELPVLVRAMAGRSTAAKLLSAERRLG